MAGKILAGRLPQEIVNAIETKSIWTVGAVVAPECNWCAAASFSLGPSR